jgi:DNA-binding transcriptional LysR family regulator
MNFTHLGAFFSVVETGSVTAASEKLHVSQPALTREIRELEERFGVPLFDRLPRGMQPTEAGKLLAQYAAQIFSLAEAAENAMGEFAGVKRGHLKLAASRTIGVYLLPSVLDEFRRLYPGVTVDVSVSNTEDVEGTLLAQDCQIGLVEGPYNTSVFDAAMIGRDQLVAVAGATHPLAGKRRVSAADIGSGELVVRESGSGTRTIVEQAYLEKGIEFKPKLSIGSPEGIKQLLRLGNAVAWVSRLSVADDLQSGVLVELSIHDLTIMRELNMIWRKERTLSPSARAFRTLASNVMPAERRVA